MSKIWGRHNLFTTVHGTETTMNTAADTEEDTEDTAAGT